jgi:orotidine-5'-phosphate decarboxylase
MQRTPRERIVFALDVPDLSDTRAWIARLHEHVGVFKVGLELFTAMGPDAVRVVHDAGAACFLDLKLHDIPATMAGAAASAVRLGVRYLTIHASAGESALRAVADVTRGTNTTPLAVTVLTSLDQNELTAIGFQGDAKQSAARLAEIARASGMGGLVCSPHEARALRAVVGPDMVIVTPGVRMRGADAGDQRRVATPRDAIEQGADLIVVGRPIRQAPDPVATARAIADEIAEVRT